MQYQTPRHSYSTPRRPGSNNNNNSISRTPNASSRTTPTNRKMSPTNKTIELMETNAAVQSDYYFSSNNNNNNSNNTTPSRQQQEQQREDADNDDNVDRLHVVVIVLGDLGRSPRMQYHALSLLQHGHDVSLVGYTGEKLIPALVEYLDDAATTTNGNSTTTTAPSHSPTNNNNSFFQSAGSLDPEQEKQALLSPGRGPSSRKTTPQRPGIVSEDSKRRLRMERGCEDLTTEREDDDEDLFMTPPPPPGTTTTTIRTGRLNVVRFGVPAPEFLQKIRVIYFIWRILSLALWLSWALLFRVTFHKPRQRRREQRSSSKRSNNNNNSFSLPHCVLVQNPPALPLLLVARLYCWMLGLAILICGRSTPRSQSRSKSLPTKKNRIPGLIIDWHNLGYSMLAERSPFRKVAKVYEAIVAPLADAHLTVTNAMKAFLESELRLPPEKVRVLPDCPPQMFQPRSLAEQHAIMQKLHPQLTKACRKSWPDSGDGNLTTLLTEFDPKTGQYQPRRGRPALITSSTSWTPDEDFGILLNALLLLDKLIMEHRDDHQARHLRVMVVVTGKGPEKAQYEVKISKLTLHHVAVTTLWLEPGDYPPFLACADVGVSLHTSTSGLDLPMKVLDLFGCQVPVCAMDFDCLSELVQDGVNGRVFADSTQLAHQLLELLQPLVQQEQQQQPGVPCHSFGKLEQFSQKLQHRQRWHTNWDQNALPVLEEVTTSGRRPSSKPKGPTSVNKL